MDTTSILLPQAASSHLFGLYTALVYFTPLIGGILADQKIGQRKAVVMGGCLMAVGHFALAFRSLFVVGLLFLVLGNGLFKPNISTQVGRLYAEGDPRRDAAFSIFYGGINVGAMLSPLVCGTLGENVSFEAGRSTRVSRHFNADSGHFNADSCHLTLL